MEVLVPQLAPAETLRGVPLSYCWEGWESRIPTWSALTPRGVTGPSFLAGLSDRPCGNTEEPHYSFIKVNSGLPTGTLLTWVEPNFLCVVFG